GAAAASSTGASPSYLCNLAVNAIAAGYEAIVDQFTWVGAPYTTQSAKWQAGTNTLYASDIAAFAECTNAVASSTDVAACPYARGTAASATSSPPTWTNGFYSTWKPASATQLLNLVKPSSVSGSSGMTDWKSGTLASFLTTAGFTAPSDAVFV